MNLKRLGVFNPKEKTDIAQDYVSYLHKSLLNFTEKIIRAEEFGADINRDEYDEIVIFDDSVFGPLFSLDKIFSEMAGRDCDLWHITPHDDYFIVLRKSFFMKPAFLEMLARDSFNFSAMLRNLSETIIFKSAAYINLAGLLHEDDEHDHGLVSPCTLIKNYGLPFLKKEIFSQRINLSFSMREEIKEAFKFIEKSTDYEIDLIWRYIIKNFNMIDIKRNLSLNYVLPASVKIADYDYSGEKIAVIVHLAYPSLVDNCCSYLVNVPDYCDIFVTTFDEEIKKRVEERLALLGNHKIRKCILVTNRGRDVSALLVGCKEIVKDYDIFCFTHDKKTAGGKGPVAVGQSYYYDIWENTLKSREYINNILVTMKENPRLGLISPPQPLHYGYINIRGKEWTNCYSGLLAWAEKLGLKCDISPDKHPFSLSTAFWGRKKALKKLFDYPFAYEDFPAEPMRTDGQLGHYLERLFMFVAQDAGFYTATALNNEYAALDLENSSFVIGEMNDMIMRNGLQWEKSREEVIEFIRTHKEARLYIYGPGVVGKLMADFLERNNIQIAGYIISDDRAAGTKDGYPIYNLKDVNLNSAIIVALDYKHTGEVKKSLQKKGHERVFYLNEADIMSDGGWLYGQGV